MGSLFSGKASNNFFPFFLRLRQRGVLISGDGPGRNVLKIKPPLVVTKEDMDMFVETLDQVLTEVASQEN